MLHCKKNTFDKVKYLESINILKRDVVPGNDLKRAVNLNRNQKAAVKVAGGTAIARKSKEAPDTGVLRSLACSRHTGKSLRDQ